MRTLGNHYLIEPWWSAFTCTFTSPEVDPEVTPRPQLGRNVPRIIRFSFPSLMVIPMCIHRCIHFIESHSQDVNKEGLDTLQIKPWTYFLGGVWQLQTCICNVRRHWTWFNDTTTTDQVYIGRRSGHQQVGGICRILCSFPSSVGDKLCTL